jgi:hypothetical protein
MTKCVLEAKEVIYETVSWRSVEHPIEDIAVPGYHGSYLRINWVWRSHLSGVVIPDG